MLEKTCALRQSAYRHHQTGEDNGDAHLKSLLVHHQVIIPVTNGKLDLVPGSRCTMPSLTGKEKEL